MLKKSLSGLLSSIFGTSTLKYNGKRHHSRRRRRFHKNRCTNNKRYMKGG